MRAMTVVSPGPIEHHPLRLVALPTPQPGRGQVLVRVEVCGVCRTDLHVAEGDLPARRSPIVPGHEVVGRVVACGPDAQQVREGDRVGVAWLHATCERCRFCNRGDENLCLAPRFTGYHEHGGYAEYMVAPAAFVYALPEGVSAVETAPFLCAGIIGYRALQRCGIEAGGRLGLYGFGGSAHIVLQIARHRNCEVAVVTRGERHRNLARQMGATWVGGPSDPLPHALDAAIVFAPAGDVVPPALAALDRGGTLALAGVYMTEIPPLDYARTLFYERTVCSVTANTRADGRALLDLARRIPLHTRTEEFPLSEATEALHRLKAGRISGAAVLRVSDGRT